MLKGLSISRELCPVIKEIGQHELFFTKIAFTKSSLLKAEQDNWRQPHKLFCIPDLRSEHQDLLPKFRRRLKLCFEQREVFGTKYQHWWITDGSWIFEFGGGEGVNHHVIVHCNPRVDYMVDTEFELTDEVMARMKAVCGASNYSLALRNCELRNCGPGSSTAGLGSASRWLGVAVSRNVSSKT